MKYYRFTMLFFSLLWSDWHGETIGIQCAYDTSKLIWLESDNLT